MTIARTLSSIRRTRQFKALVNSGLTLVSTNRQLENGTLAFRGSYKNGKQVVMPSYAVTANGAVISNEFVARRVQGEKLSDVYKNGLNAVSELLSKRLSA
jgi:hypothetical protein